MKPIIFISIKRRFIFIICNQYFNLYQSNQCSKVIFNFHSNLFLGEIGKQFDGWFRCVITSMKVECSLMISIALPDDGEDITTYSQNYELFNFIESCYYIQVQYLDQRFIETAEPFAMAQNLHDFTIFTHSMLTLLCVIEVVSVH